MLPKKYRLSKTAEVAKTTARGRTFFSPSFLIKYLIDKELTEPHITVIVSTKISKSAVTRNKIKRAIRFAVEQVLDQIRPANYAILVKKSAMAQSMVELKKEVLEALQKSKIIKL
jgi:ribonuclease P protein component